ncbi:MAG: hypothetical protein ILO68_07630, partial [Clostridia bacterium]|nr:hypothetical protein [Clostridia bacterium]
MSNRVSFTCTADPRDVLTAKAASGKDLIGELIAAMKNAVPGDLQVTKKGFNSFSISLPGGENEEDVMKRLRDAAGEVCRNLNVHETHIRSDAEEAEAEPGKANEPEAGETAGETPAEPKQGGSGRNAGSAYDAILSLVGAEEIKAWAEKVHGVSKERGDRPVLESALTGMSYLLAVDPGNGCTTILERMGALIAETLGRNGCTLKEEFPVFEEDKDNLQPIEREVSRIPEGNRLTLYAVHLDSYLSRLHTERFSLFLRRIRKAGKKIVFAFVVPMLEDSALNRILSDLEDTS